MYVISHWYVSKGGQRHRVLFVVGEELLVDRGDRFVSVVFVDDDGYLDLRGRDHADIDLLIIESLKHFARNARVAFHARAVL